MPDIFAIQYFNIWADKPAAEKPVKPADFGRNQKLSAGYYKVMQMLFRGHAVDGKALNSYCMIPEKEEDGWGFYGIAMHNNYVAGRVELQKDGSYGVQFSDAKPQTILVSFHGKNAALTIPLIPQEQTASANLLPDNCMRIELEKVADIPQDNPLQLNLARSAAQTLRTESNGGQGPAWDMHLLSKLIGGMAALILLLALLLKRIKRKK
jgi:hypothetical protein